MSAQKIPFDFVLDYMMPLGATVKPMFGCFALYVGQKITLILRLREDHPEANGVWLATGREHHKTLKKEFPSLRSIALLTGGEGESGWQMLPVEAGDFEESVVKACRLVARGDPRIGRIPKIRKKRAASRGTRKPGRK